MIDKDENIITEEQEFDLKLDDKQAELLQLAIGRNGIVRMAVGRNGIVRLKPIDKD